jgi:2TM domain
MTMSDLFPKEPLSAMTEEQRRELAIQRIKARHDFRVHLVVYVIVNAALVVLWYLTSQGANGELGFFWPVFPIVGWGIGLAIHAYVTYLPPSLTEDDIQREMKRLR